ncbi:MAG: beta-galactosidase [Clostridia bacterium]|nr:beta-galactosidase [Clostridia bacterium]
MTKKFPPAAPRVPHMVHGGDYNPDQWLEFPEVLEDDIRLLKGAGINSVSVGIFAWAALEPQEGVYTFEWLDKVIDRLYENGIYTILATPSGARPAWMDKKYPECMRTNSEGVQNTHGRRHNHCYTSPKYRELVWNMNRRLAERYKNHPGIMMWHLSNEYGGECHCPLCAEEFRSFLRKKYDNDINKLNKAWWTYFWSHKFADFDEIDPPSNRGENAVHGLNLDWRRFVTHQTNDFMKMEYRSVKEITPDIPVTANYMTYYDVLNYREMRDTLDVISWDCYPKWHNDFETTIDTSHEGAFNHDFFRSLLHKPFFLMESTPSQVNWHRINKLKRPGMHYLASLQAVAHGSDSVQYFQIRKSRGASEKFHGAVIDHVGPDTDKTRVYKEISRVGSSLSRLDEIVGTTTDSKVALIYDTYNRCAINDYQGFNNANKKYLDTCLKHYSYFHDKGYNCDIIPPYDDLSKYDIVAAPMMYMLYDGVAEKLKEYVSNGGTLVCTYNTAYVDETDLVLLGGFPGGGLRELFGIWNEETDALFPSQSVGIRYNENSLGLSGEIRAVEIAELLHLEGATALAEYSSEFYAGMPAITVNNFGKGKAYYIGARIDKKAIFDFYDAVFKDIKAEPLLSDIPEGVSVKSRNDGENEYVFIMNFSEEKKTVKLGGKYTDILTDEVYDDIAELDVYKIIIIKRKIG